jgi:proton-coupled amino acid transporter
MYFWLLLLPSIPVSLIKSYSTLSYVSIVGIVCALSGIIMLIGYCGEQLSNGNYPSDIPITIFNMKGTFVNVGIVMFVFEGNGVIMNLRANASNPDKYPKILTLAIFLIVVLYLIIAIVCYVTFRIGIPTYVINDPSIPVNGFQVFLTSLLCVNAIGSYPI